ncbi:hypothetical protein QQG74_29500 [Micromonospora sp. FIMYZ51]|uniref:hypothetical protein n=1 Tax=Micromonospora sp. FIMYZ51 TaxID=3051832 RepID=UPI00311E6028
MLSTVVFDADETLLDLRPAITGGLVVVPEEMRRLTPAAAGVSRADLESDWDAVFGELAAHDVVGAQRAGLRAIWLHRRGEQLPGGVVPAAAVSTLAELPAVLADLPSEPELSSGTRRWAGGTACVDV